MNGIKKNADFLADVQIPFSAAPDPYKNPPPCKLNLLELAKYAEKKGKDVGDLSTEEIAQFKI